MITSVLKKNGPNFRYESVRGSFLQDEPITDPTTFDFAAVNFGLIEKTYSSDDQYSGNKITQWQRFDHEISTLNHESPPNVQYKLLYMARHGEGQHNVAESLYGTKAWEASPSIKARYPGHIPTEYQNHWAKLDGNGTLIWSDAHLTAKGEAQARSANAFWANCIHTQHIPLPQMYYSSPLTRCLATASITFSDLPLPPDRPFKPIVKELLRETNGVHTCDRRSSKSYLTAKFPGFTIELGFSEEDELWNSEVRENSSEQDARMRVFLDDLFEHDESTYISLSAHSGTIASLLRVLGHRIFRLPTGAIIPVLVKVERICVND